MKIKTYFATFYFAPFALAGDIGYSHVVFDQVV
jgi:hypothetical protein